MEFQEITENVIPSKFKKLTPFIVVGVGLGLIALVNTRKNGVAASQESTKLPDDISGIFKDAIEQNNEQLSQEFGMILERNQNMYEQTVNQLRQESESNANALSSQIQQLQAENSNIRSSYNDSMNVFAGLFSGLSSSVSNMQSEIEVVKSTPISYVVSEVQTPVTTPTVTQSIAPSTQITQTPPKPSTPAKQEPIINVQTINKGDTLSGLAKKYNTTVNAIMKENPQISNPNKIYAGDLIVIPK